MMTRIVFLALTGLIFALPIHAQERAVGSLVLDVPDDWVITKSHDNELDRIGMEITSGDGGYLSVRAARETEASGLPTLRKGALPFEEIGFSDRLPGYVAGFVIRARDSASYMFSLRQDGWTYVVVMGYNVNRERVSEERITTLHDTVVGIATGFRFSD